MTSSGQYVIARTENAGVFAGQTATPAPRQEERR